MSKRSALLPATKTIMVFPILAAFFTVANSAPSQQAEKSAAGKKWKLKANLHFLTFLETFLGPSDLRSFVDLTPTYFRFYDPNEVAWPAADYDWTVGNMLAR